MANIDSFHHVHFVVCVRLHQVGFAHRALTEDFYFIVGLHLGFRRGAVIKHFTLIHLKVYNWNIKKYRLLLNSKNINPSYTIRIKNSKRNIIMRFLNEYKI